MFIFPNIIYNFRLRRNKYNKMLKGYIKLKMLFDKKLMRFLYFSKKVKKENILE